MSNYARAQDLYWVYWLNRSDAKLHKSLLEFCLYSWFKSFGVWAMITLHENTETQLILHKMDKYIKF